MGRRGGSERSGAGSFQPTVPPPHLLPQLASHLLLRFSRVGSSGSIVVECAPCRPFQRCGRGCRYCSSFFQPIDRCICKGRSICGARLLHPQHSAAMAEEFRRAAEVERGSDSSGGETPLHTTQELGHSDLPSLRHSCLSLREQLKGHSSNMSLLFTLLYALHVMRA